MNIYIKAMEIGSKNLEKGITFPDMLCSLTNKSKTEILATPDSNFNFAMWFINNFSCRDFNSNYNGNNKDFKYNIYRYYFDLEGHLLSESEMMQYEESKVKTRESIKAYNTTKYISKFFNQKFFLNGETNKQYIDYLELKESRESSQEALKKANISILVAVIALLISAGFSGLEYFKEEPNYPQPPFEVKVKEPIEVKQPILIDTTNYGTIQTD